MIRHLVAFAGLLCLAIPAAASAADSGGAAAPGQTGSTTSATETTAAEAAAADTTGTAPALYNGLTVDETVKLMEGIGYRAVVLTDSSGFPYIESGGSGLVFEVNFYGCDGGTPDRCLQLQFRASFSTDEAQKEKALQYNVDKVFGRAYNLNESTYLEHAMHTNGGVTGEYFTNNLLLWDNVLGEFARYIDW
jgi:hypothetical protein